MFKKKKEEKKEDELEEKVEVVVEKYDPSLPERKQRHLNG